MPQQPWWSHSTLTASPRVRTTAHRSRCRSCPQDLRTLAVGCLDRVVDERSEIAELWNEATDGARWRQDITRLRDVLDPPIQPQEEALFEMMTSDHRYGPQKLSQSPFLIGIQATKDHQLPAQPRPHLLFLKMHEATHCWSFFLTGICCSPGPARRDRTVAATTRPAVGRRSADGAGEDPSGSHPQNRPHAHAAGAGIEFGQLCVRCSTALSTVHDDHLAVLFEDQFRGRVPQLPAAQMPCRRR
ncbi:DUF4259 domain-containing protein [Streptomyces shenzhenensis]|uniref:DUF4259 domain-containing protein n=1 Tax=Streptomyces shenzhenensis TaxID=943815 RepID=UPI003D8D175D